MAARILPWLLLALALACGGAGVLYHLWDEADERADLYEDKFIKQRAIAGSTKEYVHDIQYLPAPDDVIARRAERLCHDLVVRGDRPDGDGGGAADPDHHEDRDGEGRDFAVELRYCWENTRQLTECQRQARLAGCAK